MFKFLPLAVLFFTQLAIGAVVDPDRISDGHMSCSDASQVFRVTFEDGKAEAKELLKGNGRIYHVTHFNFGVGTFSVTGTTMLNDNVFVIAGSVTLPKAPSGYDFSNESLICQAYP